MINPIWLQTFCELAETGHFTETAKRLFMTQSGVTQHIQKLEQQIGSKLLYREGKSFKLTERGENLYHQGKPLLFELQRLNHSENELQGNITIMSPGSVGLRLYPQLLSLQQRQPTLTIDHRFAPNSDIEQALLERRVHIGILNQRPKSGRINYYQIGSEALQLVLPHSFADDSPDWQTLCSLGMISHPDAPHHANLLLGKNYPEFRHIEQITHRGFSNQISLILEPVSLGLGFCILPSYAIRAFNKPEKIKVAKLPNSVSEPLYLCSLKDTIQPTRVQQVITTIEAALHSTFQDEI